MNHLEFAARESAALEPTTWDLWIRETERMALYYDIIERGSGLGLDGDEAEDGYSMDGAFVAFGDGKTPVAYLLTVQRNRRVKEIWAQTETAIDHSIRRSENRRARSARDPGQELEE